METHSLSHSHSLASSILYTHKPLTSTNQAFPLFHLPCTRSHSTNHLFSSSLHLHRPSPNRPCHASATPDPPPDSDPPPGSDSVFNNSIQLVWINYISIGFVCAYVLLNLFIDYLSQFIFPLCAHYSVLPNAALIYLLWVFLSDLFWAVTKLRLFTF